MMFVLILLAQPLNLNTAPIEVRQDGVRVPTRQRQYVVDCRTNMTCAVDGGILFLSASGGGGYDGGKVGEAFAADASIYANQLLVDPAACVAGEYVSDVAANGTLTCSQPPYPDGGSIYWYDGGQGFIFAQPLIRNPDGGISLIASQNFAGHRIVLGVENQSANALARGSLGFYAGGPTVRGEIYGSSSTSGGRSAGLNINSNSGAAINFSYGDPTIETCAGGGACSYGQFVSSTLGFVSRTPAGSVAWGSSFNGAHVDLGTGATDYLYSDGGAIVTHGIFSAGSYVRLGQFATGSLPAGLAGATAYDTTDGVPKFHNGTTWTRYDSFKVGEAYAADASVFANQLAANPTDCGGGQFANAIDALGNLTCATPSVSGKVAEAYMADASIFAVEATTARVAYSADASYQAIQLVNNPTDCISGQFANAIDQSGNLTCSTPAGGGGSANFTADVATFTGQSDALKTVTAVWATGTSNILCTADGEEASVEGAQFVVKSKAAGSFVVRGYVLQGVRTGATPFTCTGN